MHTATLGDAGTDGDVIELTETKGALVRGCLSSEDELWWATRRAGLRNKDGRVRVKSLLKQGLEREIKPRTKKRRRREVSDAAPEALSMIESSTQDLEVPDYDENMHEEMRIVIRVCVLVIRHSNHTHGYDLRSLISQLERRGLTISSSGILRTWIPRRSSLQKFTVPIWVLLESSS